MVTAFDPRSDLRTAIGYTKYVQGEDRSTVSVDDSYGDKMYIPIVFPYEARTETPLELPLIEMNLMSAPSRTISIGGDVCKNEAYLDFNIQYVVKDGIGYTFGNDVASEIKDKIMEYRSSVSNTMFVEVIDDGKEYYQGTDGGAVIFHKVVQIYCEHIQKKS